jgi:hypothetical protein
MSACPDCYRDEGDLSVQSGFDSPLRSRYGGARQAQPDSNLLLKIFKLVHYQKKVPTRRQILSFIVFRGLVGFYLAFQRINHFHTFIHQCFQ